MTHEQLRYQFERNFREQPDLIIRSRGRVNLIGEHTDYNDGWTLPMALDLGTDIAARRGDDRLRRIAAPLLGAADVISVEDLDPRQRLQAEPLRARHRSPPARDRPPGARADLLIDGDLLVAAGLSSSASLELAVAAALAALADYAIDGAALARPGQRVENEIIGVRSGIMDQLAIALGVAGHALRIDCRSLEAEPVPIPSGVRILVFESAVPRTVADSAYNQRRTECEAALKALQAADPNLRALRDVTASMLRRQARRLTRYSYGAPATSSPKTSEYSRPPPRCNAATSANSVSC